MWELDVFVQWASCSMFINSAKNMPCIPMSSQITLPILSSLTCCTCDVSKTSTSENATQNPDSGRNGQSLQGVGWRFLHFCACSSQHTPLQHCGHCVTGLSAAGLSWRHIIPASLAMYYIHFQRFLPDIHCCCSWASFWMRGVINRISSSLNTQNMNTKI